MIYIGGDLGNEGAVVFLTDKGKILKKTKTPLLKAAMKKGKKGKDEYDVLGMRTILTEAKEMDAVAMVERAQPLPAVLGGVAANYQRGLSFGLWQGLLAGIGIPYEVVRPQDWQKVMLSGINTTYDTKQASVIAAQRLWPNEDWRRSERAKKADDGFTDSALLAEFGRRRRNGQN